MQSPFISQAILDVSPVDASKRQKVARQHLGNFGKRCGRMRALL